MDGYVLIAGERRVRASKLAKLKTIRAIVLNSDEHKMRQFALIENIQRDELNPIELAYAYGELIKLHNITHDELAVKIHKNRTHITNTLRLLHLSLKTQRALIEKKITAGHAKVLVGLDEKEQQLMVDSIIGQKLSVREVEAAMKSVKNSSTKATSKQESVAYDLHDVRESFANLGFATKSNAKSITIEFQDTKQIAQLLELLAR